MENEKRIQILDPLVAQRIAAGEVIDRPASIVRELIDNSIDARSTTITVELIEGGIEKITVIDDGKGIRKEDLPLCAQSHATSKVSSLDDLLHLDTMGFRGEALYSIAAGATLTISSTPKGSMGATIVIDNGQIGKIVPGGPSKGTVITVKDLFAHIPARRMFLKKGSSEARMCKVAMIEKALAFPHISFFMYHKGKLSLELPATTAKQRVLDILKNDNSIVPSEIIEMKAEGGEFSLYAIATKESTYRTDRSYIKIFVNNRIVDEYSMVQAVTYGYDPFLPGGGYPYCYLFISDNPELVDFNIHPAKREVKLRNKAEIHHEVVVMIKEHLQQYHTSSFASSYQFSSVQPQFVSEQKHRHTSTTSIKKADVEENWFERAKQLLREDKEVEPVEQVIENERSFRYIGQLFKVFLVVEKENSLFLIDQHAAHERILYDGMKNIEGTQPLMIPFEFEVERSIDTFLSHNHHWYNEFGITLERTGELLWAITSIIPHYKAIEADVVKAIQSYKGNNIEELQKTLFATAACKKAIKAGDPIERTSAIELIKKVFMLEYPVCPHGRNFVVEITKEDLYTAVGRTL